MHGSVRDMFLLVERTKEEKPNKVVFTGDFCGRGDAKLFKEAVGKISAPIIYVDGNCDTDDGLSRYGLVSSGSEYVDYCFNRRIYATHGHIRNRRNVPDYLTKGDVFVYGHLHTHFIMEQDGIIFVNCGSMARPRDGEDKSYVVIDDEGIRVKDGEYGEVILERKW